MTRDELKKFNKDRNLGVRILKSMSDEDIVEALREAMTPNDSPEEDEEEEEDGAPVETEPEEDGELPWEKEDETPASTSKAKEDLKSRLAKFKK